MGTVIPCLMFGRSMAKQQQGNIINFASMIGEAPELIGCMNWLIDERNAGFVTGITVPIDGGFLTSPGV